MLLVHLVELLLSFGMLFKQPADQRSKVSPILAVVIVLVLVAVGITIYLNNPKPATPKIEATLSV